jgi:hypothetical protein
MKQELENMKYQASSLPVDENHYMFQNAPSYQNKKVQTPHHRNKALRTISTAHSSRKGRAKSFKKIAPTKQTRWVPSNQKQHRKEVKQKILQRMFGRKRNSLETNKR